MSDLNNSEKRLTFFKVSQETVKEYRKLGKYYQCKIRRQKSKIQNLNSLLKTLNNEKKLSSSQLQVLEVPWVS